MVSDNRSAYWQVQLLDGYRVLHMPDGPIDLTPHDLDGHVPPDGVEDVTPSGQPGLLLRVVAAHEQLRVPHVSSILWRDLADKAAQRRLRNTLSRLRGQCGPIVEREGGHLVLAPRVEVDARRFRHAATAALDLLHSSVDDGPARPTLTEPASHPAGENPTATDAAIATARKALDLYRGVPLPTDPYEDWATEARQRLERLHLSLVDALAEALASRGERRQAVELLRRGIHHAPHDEERYLQAARILLEDDRRGAAAGLLRQARRRLAEGQREPSAELMALEEDTHRP